MGKTDMMVLTMPHREKVCKPSIVVRANALTLNCATLRLLNHPEYIQCLMSEDHKTFGLRPCSGTDVGAISCCKKGKKKTFQVSSTDILRFSEENGWGPTAMKIFGQADASGQLNYTIASAFLVAPRKKRQSMTKPTEDATAMPPFSKLTKDFESLGMVSA